MYSHFHLNECLSQKTTGKKITKVLRKNKFTKID